MSTMLKGNYIFVQRGQKAFKIASNITNYVELGVPGITDYHLEAKIEHDEFIINATLFNPNVKEPCRIVNSIPEKSDYQKVMTPHGYNFLDIGGELLLGIAVNEENLCTLQGKIYDSSGRLIAEDKDSDFLIYHGPAVLGKSGSARGIFIG